MGAEPLATRARIILACVAGGTNAAVAREVGVAGAVVGKWKTAFLYERVAGLAPEPPPRRESPSVLLRSWDKALVDVAHDRAILERLGLWPTSSAKALAEAVARLPAAKRRELVACRLCRLTGDRPDAFGAIALIDAAAEAGGTARFAADVDEFGLEALLPDAAATLIDLVRDAKPRSAPGTTERPRAVNPPAVPKPEIPAARIRRVAPDPRLLDPDAED